MIELLKCEEKIGENLLPKEKYDEVYKLVEDKKVIGVGVINYDKENMISILIRKELRGNGYGKILFSKMMEQIKNKGHKQIVLEFEKVNIPMVKIVSDNKGVQVSINENYVKYIVPLK